MRGRSDLKKVAVIGGGVIGLASAYYLRKQGADVVLIEKEELGYACSRGNAGLVTPSLFQPLPNPDLVWTSIRWMLKKDSPLYIKPSSMIGLSGWLYRFWRHCNEKAYKRGNDAGYELSRNALTLFDEIEADGVSFEGYRNGFVFVFLDKKQLLDTKEEFSVLGGYGMQLPIEKTAEEVHVMAGENILSKNIVGGLFLPNERHLRPESFAGGLGNWLRDNNTEIKTNTEVTDLIVENNKVTKVMCGTEEIEADDFLLTAGIWSEEIVRKVGFKIPLVAGKGYNITYTNPSFSPKIPIHLGDLKVGMIPYEGAVRVVGTMEMSGTNNKIDRDRVESLRKGFPNYFKSELTAEKEKVWTGMRPMTPDGVPILGKVPGLSNMFLATGHAMSGIYMSLATGLHMSELIIEGKSGIDLTPFSPVRFNRKQRIAT